MGQLLVADLGCVGDARFVSDPVADADRPRAATARPLQRSQRHIQQLIAHGEETLLHRLEPWGGGTAFRGKNESRCEKAALSRLPDPVSISVQLTKRQQNQPFMVNALLSVVVYFVLQWHRVTVSFWVA